MGVTRAVIDDAVAMKRRIRVREWRKWTGNMRWEGEVRRERDCWVM